MKTYWKYIYKDSPEEWSIWVRDTKHKTEKCLFATYAAIRGVDNWARYENSDMRNERRDYDDIEISRITEEEAFLEAI